MWKESETNEQHSGSKHFGKRKQLIYQYGSLKSVVLLKMQRVKHAENGQHSLLSVENATIPWKFSGESFQQQKTLLN